MRPPGLNSTEENELDLLPRLEPAARLFTYKVAYDAGSAPNPYHELCTLAICKPAIRRVARPGDLVVGLACAPDERRIVYCMLADHVLPWADYIKVCTGRGEIPDGIPGRGLRMRVPLSGRDPGDCIWPDASRFEEARESWSGHRGPGDWKRDVEGGENVILSARYWYFGIGDQHPIRLGEELLPMVPGRGHRSNANQEFREAYREFFNRELEARGILRFGRAGVPELDSGADDATRARCRAREREFDTCGEERIRDQRGAEH